MLTAQAFPMAGDPPAHPLSRSTDGGRTWEVGTRRGYDYPRQIAVEPDGSLLIATALRPDWHGEGYGVPILQLERSADEGRTWSVTQGRIDWECTGFGEVGAVRLRDGRLLASLRRQIPGTQGEGFEDSVLTASADDGRTWARPWPLTTTAQVHAHLCELSDGRLVCTYSNYHVPFGVSAMLSQDGGRSWQADRTVRLSTSNGFYVGWAVTLELEDRSLATVYAATTYPEQPPDRCTCEVVRWRLPVEQGLRVAAAAGSLACADHPYYRREDELLITRGRRIAVRTACQRLLLPRLEGWPTHHVHGHVGRTRDGRLWALVGGGDAAQRWVSEDGGCSWQGEELALPGFAGFAVLDDDSFLAVTGGGATPIETWRSTDCGCTWQRRGRLPSGRFDTMHVDSNLLRLRGGTVLLAGMMCLRPPPGVPWNEGHYAQYVFRSEDRGATWQGGGDPSAWAAVAAGRERLIDDGPGFTWPGLGGSFSGVYETGFCQLRSGLVLGAFRFSGPPRPWHHEAIARWGEPPAAPDGHGRIFRHVVLGESADEGRTWRNLRPVLDGRGQPLMLHGECNGELVELSDGRLVLVHQTRYAEGPDRERGFFRGRSQLCARLSTDQGRTWQRQRYRVLFGFGYSSTLALEEDTLVTVTGACLGENGEPRRAAVVRWRVRAATGDADERRVSP